MDGILPYLEDHISVRLDNCIVVIGGYTYDAAGYCHYIGHNVWMYNLYLEQWKKYQIPKKKQVPSNLIGACGVVIGEVIYTFGGHGTLEDGFSEMNELWKLIRNTNSNFEWSRILVRHKKKTPSPRIITVAGSIMESYGHLAVVDHQ